MQGLLGSLSWLPYNYMYMRVIQRIISISILVLACVFAGLTFASTVKDAQAETLPSPDITMEIPHNPQLAQQGDDKSVFIDNFAWKVFVALNWPADCLHQGVPLENKKIGEAPESPRVWEFYRIPEEVFFPAGKEPPTQPTKPFTCVEDRNSLNTGHNSTVVQLTESGMLAGEDNDADPAMVPLVDQHGNYIINETRINPKEFDQIVKNKWYDAIKLAQFNSDKNFTLVCSGNENDNLLGVPCSTYEKEGAIEIKAAWRVFDERNSEAEKARYYTTKRKLLIPADRSDTGVEFSQVVEVGLIGFHIKHKTSEQGWIWSTFEQVDNVPDGTPTPVQYTLYNPNCTENCKQNDYHVIEAPYYWQKEAPHAVKKVGGEIRNQILSQIVRSPEPLFYRQTSKQNEQWQHKLRHISESSVWQYYKLIGTEWLSNPGLPYDLAKREISPAPPLANVAIEPYIQTTNCIDCHTGATLKNVMKPNEASSFPMADFSFQMAKAEPSNSGVINAQ